MKRPLMAVANLTRLSVGEKIVLGTGIGQALSTHPGVFKTPVPSAAELAAVTQELIDAADDAATGARAGRGRLSKAETAFNKAVRRYVIYVNQEAQGDAEIIGQSGLPMGGDVQRAEPLGAPTGGQLKGTNPGELTAMFATLPGARAYVWQVAVGATAPTDEAAWRYPGGTTASRRSLTGLPSGQRVWVRVAAIGTRGQGPWSEPVSRIVL